MKRRAVAVVVVVALAGMTTACAGAGRRGVARSAGVHTGPHHARSAARLELDDTASLSGEPQGFAVDDRGAVVEVDGVKVVALDPQGADQWSTPVAGAAYGWPWLGRGVAVVPTLSEADIGLDGAERGGCVALDRATGKVRWSYGEAGRSGVAVAGLDNRAYCVFRDATMAAIDIDTGKLVWRGELMHDAPKNQIEVAERTAIVIEPATQQLVFTVHYGRDWMIVFRDLATGADRGGTDLDRELTPSAPVLIAPGRVAIAHGAGEVCALDLRKRHVDGCVDVAAPEGFDSASVPVVADGLVIVAAADGSVFAVDLAARKVRWTAHLDTVFLDAKPAVADGVVIIADGARATWGLRVSDGSKVTMPATDGFVVSTAADPHGGVAVAVRADLFGEIQRWRPTG